MMRRKKRRRKNFSGIALLALICMTLTGWNIFNLFAEKQRQEAPPSTGTVQTETPKNTSKRLISSTPETLPEAALDEYPIISNLDINSSQALLVRLDDQKTLFDKSSNEKIYPASMTKMMTAIVALENIDDVKEQITLHNSVFYYITQASVAGFVAGEEVRAIDLLYGLMLPSGAECAVGLADYVAGGESAFVDLMNEKAKTLGMDHTHFANSTGLHDDNHYTTAKDIAILLQYAIENDTFYEIITSSRHSTPPTNKHEGGITYYSTLFSKIDNPDFDGVSILGGKTGFTEEAGLCLASLAEVNDHRYILVTCGAQGKGSMDTLHIDDAITIYSAIRQKML